MIFNLISNVITKATSNTNVTKPMGVRMPDPEYRIKWNPKEGKIKIEEKKRDFFDPRVY